MGGVCISEDGTWLVLIHGWDAYRSHIGSGQVGGGL